MLIFLRQCLKSLWLVTDIYAQKRYANARTGTPTRSRWGGKTPPVPAVPEVLQLQPSARSTHQGTHWREALQMLLL